MVSLIMVHRDTLFPMFYGSLIRLINVVRFYFDRANVTSKEYISFCHQALSFYLVIQHLTFTDLEYDDLWIYFIISSLKIKRNMILIVLAETFNGWDLIHDNPYLAFMESLLLLQMWLLDHFGLLDVSIIPHYGLQHYQPLICYFNHTILSMGDKVITYDEQSYIFLSTLLPYLEVRTIISDNLI